jgi:hypothetical protein
MVISTVKIKVNIVPEFQQELSLPTHLKPAVHLWSFSLAANESEIRKMLFPSTAAK